MVITPKEKKIKKVTYSYGKKTISVEKRNEYTTACAFNPKGAVKATNGPEKAETIAIGVMIKFKMMPIIIIMNNAILLLKLAKIGVSLADNAAVTPVAVQPCADSHAGGDKEKRPDRSIFDFLRRADIDPGEIAQAKSKDKEHHAVDMMPRIGKNA